MPDREIDFSCLVVPNYIEITDLDTCNFYKLLSNDLVTFSSILFELSIELSNFHFKRLLKNRFLYFSFCFFEQFFVSKLLFPVNTVKYKY